MQRVVRALDVATDQIGNLLFAFYCVAAVGGLLLAVVLAVKSLL